MMTPLIEHGESPMPDPCLIPSIIKGVRSMNESQRLSDRDRIDADAEKYQEHQAKELLEAFYAVNDDDAKTRTDYEQARGEAAAESSTDGNSDNAPSNDMSDGCTAADQLAWFLAAEDDADFVRRVFQDFEARLNELVGRIAVVVEDGHLDAGWRRALFNRILDSSQFLIDVAGALEPDPNWYAR
jgi:hypothetical protein